MHSLFKMTVINKIENTVFFKQKLIQRGGNRNAGTIFRLAKLAVFGYIEWKTWFHQPNYSTKIYNGQNDCMK